MIPSRQLLVLIALWALLGFAAGWFAALVEIWWASGAILLVLAIGDARLARQVPGVGWNVPSMASGRWDNESGQR